MTVFPLSLVVRCDCQKKMAKRKKCYEHNKQTEPVIIETIKEKTAIDRDVDIF